MFKFNKKFLVCPVFGFLLLSGIFWFNIGAAHALSQDIRQVKVSGKSTVYYLNHATHQRKAYLNAAIFLSYGNVWSDVKIISQQELDKWPEARLVKITGSDNLYYIYDGKKIKLRNQQDIFNYHLENVRILTISAFELEQYQNQGENSNPVPPVMATTTPPVGSSTPPIQSDPANLTLSLAPFSPNADTLVPGTNDNEVMALRLQAGNKATNIQRLTFDFKGLFSTDLVDKVRLYDANGKEYRSSNSRDGYKIIVNLYQDQLYLSSASAALVTVKIDLESCDNCNNQNLYASVSAADSVAADVAVSGIFPINGPIFNLVSTSNIVGQGKIEEETVSSSTTGVKILGRFKASEESGREDINFKRLVFENLGTAGHNDLKNFKLKRGSDVIATADAMVNGKIDFAINYLRVSQASPVELTVIAAAGDEYESGITANLRLSDAEAVGKTYNLSIPVDNIDLDNTIILP